MKTERMTAGQARRIALAAQGFGRAQPDIVDQGHLRRTIDRLGLLQIDSVNVLSRAHYLPLFSRLGAYNRTLLDTAAWGRRSQRRLFEYWAHEASLIPLALQPLFRWRMARADAGEIGWRNLRAFAGERRPDAMALLARIGQEGPRSASELAGERGPGGWWGWSDTKMAIEWLFWAGHLTTATRRNSFERVYDLPDNVLPDAILALPTPSAADAQRALIDHAARAHGIATEIDLRDYFRLGPEEARCAIATLVEEGTLLPFAVDGWRNPAYLHRDARRPRRIEAQALLAPFDPLVWERARTERIFGFRYRIEIYTPADKRQFGYYVLPFLLGDALVGRVDLKADRQNGRLLVQSIHREPGAPADMADALDRSLRDMAGWLGLDRVDCAGPAAG